MVKRRLNEDPIVVVAVAEEAVVEMTDDQDNHAKWVLLFNVWYHIEKRKIFDSEIQIIIYK